MPSCDISGVYTLLSGVFVHRKKVTPTTIPTAAAKTIFHIRRPGNHMIDLAAAKIPSTKYAVQIIVTGKKNQ